MGSNLKIHGSMAIVVVVVVVVVVFDVWSMLPTKAGEGGTGVDPKRASTMSWGSKTSCDTTSHPPRPLPLASVKGIVDAAAAVADVAVADAGGFSSGPSSSSRGPSSGDSGCFTTF